MTPAISPELYWLGWSIVLTAAMVIPYAAYRTAQLGGLWQVFLRPLPGDAPFAAEWAHRAYRAHMNAFEGLALFAPAVIAAHVAGVSDAVTTTSAAVYFFARLIYAPLYYFNVPIFRTAIWMVSLAATLTIAVRALLIAPPALS